MNFSSLMPSRMVLLGMCALGTAASARADITATTAPYGVMAEAVPRGTRGLAFPLIASNLYLGRVEASAAGILVLSSESLDPRGALVGSGPAYVEVLDGPWEGERLELDVAATGAADGSSLVVLPANPRSTRATLPPDGLAGARVAVRPHVTLAGVQAMLSPGLQGSNQAGKADAIHVFENGRFERYYLRADRTTWRRHGSNQDQRHLVIPPDVSVLLETRSGGRTWLHAGVVRNNAFRKNLTRGEQAFASGFPLDLSPIAVGAFVDSETPANYRWRGALLFPFADWFEQYGEGVPLLNRYFLQPNGRSWRRVLDLRDVAHAPVLEATGMFVLRRNNPDPDYVIPVPF